jgi:hypothetical protein
VVLDEALEDANPSSGAFFHILSIALSCCKLLVKFFPSTSSNILRYVGPILVAANNLSVSPFIIASTAPTGVRFLTA